ncbi:two-component system sensor histidine kinase NtrB [Chitinivibrio alkaliphilus]|nr:ATP-binding protein [Chitinivibrio alkaliphilus]
MALLYHIYHVGPHTHSYTLRVLHLITLNISMIYYPLVIHQIIQRPHTQTYTILARSLAGITILRILLGYTLGYGTDILFTQTILPWGETIYLFHEETEPLKLIHNILFIAMVVYTGSIIHHAHRHNAKCPPTLFPLHTLFLITLSVDALFLNHTISMIQLTPFITAGLFGGIAVILGNKMNEGLLQKELLFERNQQLSQLLNNDDIGIFTKDRNSRFVLPGKHICKILNKTEKEVQGKTIQDFIPFHEAARIHKADSYILQTGASDEFEEEFSYGGKEHSYLTYKSPLRNKDGTIQGLIGISINRMPQKIMQEKIAQVEKFTSLGELAGEIAHNFNNQLTSILGYADMLLASEEFHRKSVEDIISIAESTSQYIRQLLDFSQKGTRGTDKIFLSALITATLEHLYLPPEAAITVHTCISHPDMCVEGHRANLQNALTNICVNARDSLTEEGEITIAVKRTYLNKPQAKLLALSEGFYAHLIVEDTGSGIPREIQEKIFTPFFTTKTKDRGTGLGLSSVYKTVKAHKGGIILYSTPEEGTTFEIYLPEYCSSSSES